MNVPKPKKSNFVKIGTRRKCPHHKFVFSIAVRSLTRNIVQIYITYSLYRILPQKYVRGWDLGVGTKSTTPNTYGFEKQ